MWITLYDSFLSIVAYDVTPPQPDKLYVRARIRGDIEKIFPKAEVLSTPDADYAYRAILTRTEVSRAMDAEIQDIDYINFKNSVLEIDRHDAYLKFWTVMCNLQQDRKTADAPHRGRKLVGRAAPAQPRAIFYDSRGVKEDDSWWDASSEDGYNEFVKTTPKLSLVKKGGKSTRK